MNTNKSIADEATPVAAILSMFAAGFLFSCLDTSGKYLVTHGMSAPFVAWVRFVEHTLLAIVLLRAWSNPDIFRVRNLGLQVVRGALLFGSTFFNFQALRTLQLAETVTVFFVSPMVITALAGPLLGEWAGWRRWAAIFVGFLGVLVVARPGMHHLGIGFLFITCAMLSYVLYALLTRKMAANETPESLIFFSALTPSILMSPSVVYATLPADATQWTLILLLGLLGGTGHWMIIQAYRRASTTALAPYPYLQMVWMVMFGYFVFGQLPDRFTVLGAVIIAGSGLYIVHRERRLRLQSRSAPTTEDRVLAKKL